MRRACCRSEYCSFREGCPLEFAQQLIAVGVWIGEGNIIYDCSTACARDMSYEKRFPSDIANEPSGCMRRDNRSPFYWNLKHENQYCKSFVTELEVYTVP